MHAPLRHRAAGGRPVRARTGRADVRVRDHAVRLDPPRPRGDVPHLRHPHPPARGARSRGAHGAQRHRRRRLDPARRPASSASRTSSSPRRSSTRFHADMDALGMRPPIAEPRATETIDEIVVDRRAAARLRPRVPHPRHGVLRRLDVAELREAVALLARPDGAPRPGAGRQPRRPAPPRPARLRALAAVARRRARVARAVRRRPARAGTSSARRCRCRSSVRRSTCTVAAPT